MKANHKTQNMLYNKLMKYENFKYDKNNMPYCNVQGSKK